MLLRATLLQAFFSVRSELMLMEQINYNLLFRWFVGLPMDAEVWHPTGFTPTIATGCWRRMSREFLAALLALPQVKKLPSSEHFSKDAFVRPTMRGEVGRRVGEIVDRVACRRLL